MNRFWWVNHKQTFRQEVQGGYLWSPKREANGARSQFYDNMRQAKPGDFVISYANAQIANIGIITGYAFSARKPAEYGDIGSYWAAEGWLLPVAWQELERVLQPKEIIQSIREHLPDKYSPINPKTGFGNQKAYLANISKDLFNIICAETRFEPLQSTFSPASSRQEIVKGLEDVVQQSIENDISLNNTERKQLVKARIGQGIFRRNLFAIELKCRITGIDNPSLLLASHIKPWRSCDTSIERLDGCNGLLLTPDADHLFDLGFISFSSDGNVLLSSNLQSDDMARLGLREHCNKNCGLFNDKQAAYLEFHRNEIFMK